MHSKKHSADSIAHAATCVFTVRGLLRKRLAQGRRTLDPFAWLHMETLVFIRDHTAPTMRELADHFSIAAPSATSLIASLERKGFAKRTADTKDGRSVRLTLTPAGKTFLIEKSERGMQTLRDLFAPLSSQQLKAFTHMLDVIIKKWDQNSNR